jgi:hypothetical protein
MRKIAGPGHVSNEFVDYDEITNPDGTVITAQWANDVQRELIGIQDELSIDEADGSNKYVLAAIIGLSIKHGKQLGELFFLSDYKAVAEFDKDSPEDFFPAVCLSTIEGKEDISATNYPTLVPELRARPAYYERGKTGEKYQFDVTGWAIVSNVATLTFANTTAENEILSALSADNVVNGGYSDWQTITLAAAIGDIAAGDYNITDVDAVSRTISFAYTDSDNSGSVTATVSFYRHRIAGSTTTARLFQISEDALMSVGGDRVSMFRQLDQMQRITGIFANERLGNSSSEQVTNGALYDIGNYGSEGAAGGSTSGLNIGFDSSLSPDARTSATTDGQTRPKNTAAFVYMWAQEFIES